MTYTPSHLPLWTRPDNYAGPNWGDYYVVMSRHRDSDALDRSNWRVALEALQKHEEKLGDAMLDADGDSLLQVVCDHHWAVGWVEFIYLRRDAPEALLEAADEMRRRLKDYPVLDEDDWSTLEYEEACDYWERMSVRERVEYLQEADISIFAARRKELPEDPSGRLYEMLRS